MCNIPFFVQIEQLHCGDPNKCSVNARCLDDFDPETMRPGRFFDGRQWEAAFASRVR
jgi:hypothetical protein